LCKKFREEALPRHNITLAELIELGRTKEATARQMRLIAAGHATIDAVNWVAPAL
jgi:hypothetical protein